MRTLLIAEIAVDLTDHAAWRVVEQVWSNPCKQSKLRGKTDGESICANMTKDFISQIHLPVISTN